MRSFRSVIDLACVAGPKVAGGICLVFLNIGLMGWLGRESFGIYSLCLAGIGLLSEGLFGAAIDMGVLRLAPLYLAADATRALSIERAALRLKVHVIGSLSLAMMLGSIPLSHLLFQREGTAYLITISCAAAWGTLLLGSALLHVQVRGYFWRYAVLESVHILIKFGGIGLLLFAFNRIGGSTDPGNVLIWFALGPLAAYALFLGTIGRNFFRPLAQPDRAYLELFGFVKWFLVSLLLTSLVARMDVFLLSTLTTIDEVGIFAGGQAIASIPGLIGMYAGIVFSPKVMPYWRAGKFYDLLRKTQALLIGISAISYGLIFWYRDFLMAHLLPESFGPSANVILILLPGAFAGMTSFPLVIVFLMFVCPRFLIRLECVLLPWLLIAYVALISNYGAVGAAVATAGLSLIKTLIAQYVAFQWARKSPEEIGLAFDSHEMQPVTAVS